MKRENFVSKRFLIERMLELEKLDRKYCEYKKDKIHNFKEDILKRKTKYSAETKELYQYLNRARNVLERKDSYVLQMKGFEQIKDQLLALEKKVWLELYLQEYSDKEIKITKEFRVAPTNGFFSSIGIIAARELGYDYFDEKIALTKDLKVDVRAKEKFYSTRFRTLQENRFLSFEMNRGEIKQFCVAFFCMGEDDFNEWLNLFFNLLQSPQIFDKPPYDPSYCYQIRNYGIFNGDGHAIAEWEKIS